MQQQKRIQPKVEAILYARYTVTTETYGGGVISDHKAREPSESLDKDSVYENADRPPGGSIIFRGTGHLYSLVEFNSLNHLRCVCASRLSVDPADGCSILSPRLGGLAVLWQRRGLPAETAHMAACWHFPSHRRWLISTIRVNRVTVRLNDRERQM